MGYLVKASFNAEPRSYALDGIRTDVKAGILPLTAMVREETQDFWYSVGELIGDSPAKEFQFDCPRCHTITHAREIDVGLKVGCQKCSEMILAPDIQPPQDPTPDLPLLRRGNRLLILGAGIFIGDLIFSAYFGSTFLVSRALELMGACMMINGYGKRALYYRKHPSIADTSPQLPKA